MCVACWSSRADPAFGCLIIWSPSLLRQTESLRTVSVRVLGSRPCCSDRSRDCCREQSCAPRGKLRRGRKKCPLLLFLSHPISTLRVCFRCELPTVFGLPTDQHAQFCGNHVIGVLSLKKSPAEIVAYLKSVLRKVQVSVNSHPVASRKGCECYACGFRVLPSCWAAVCTACSLVELFSTRVENPHGACS